ncbi:MAG TPA: amidohydrolase family protein [Tepidisphaeraceae bacterium]
MAHPFCPGYVDQPYRSLAESFPAEQVYPAGDFRVEWGPIFHRGRLDGSARVLLIGQDPAANETVVRRILVGVAGQRVQGFLAKLGMTRGYVMINTFLYSVYGQQGGQKHRNDANIAAYRNLWLDALVKNNALQAVVALGTLADSAWKQYRATPGAAAATAHLAYVAIPHPTYPESAAKNNAQKLKANTAAMLAKWNVALATLHAALTAVDEPRPLVPYGDAFADGDLADIPEYDLPAGLPAFMRQRDGWASRTGTTAAQRRATLTITVPALAGGGGGAPHAMAKMAAPGASRELAGALVAAEHVIVHAPVDPAPTGRLALKGRIVTMADHRVIERGVVYVDSGVIVAVQEAGAPAPAGFTTASMIDTRGTVYPGLIELHNHLSYNALRLWDVPAKYTNRDQWAGIAEYRKRVSGPMSVIGPRPDLVPSLVRYVECKALLGGTTTTQGISLSANPGIGRYYRGIVRNVEETGEDALPDATTRIGDVESKDRGKFLKRLNQSSCLLLHLSEGKDDAAREHFLALKGDDGEWAISGALAGIHSAGLHEEDFDVLAARGGAMVWSPLSNLLLYGDTALVDAAKAAGVRIGLGADWSPSGSKNILGEVKAAKAWSALKGGLFSDEEIIAMVTTTAANILSWDRALGSIEVGKKADLLVLGPQTGDPYATLIGAKETDIELVVINGLKRYGTKKNMKDASANLERITVGGRERYLNLENANGDPLPGVTLASATQTLKQALSNLPQLAKEAEHPGDGPGPHPVAAAAALARAGGGPVYTLDLDEIEQTGVELRPHLPGTAHRFTGPTPVPARAAALAAAKPLSELLVPLELDRLTVVDDGGFLNALEDERNLPAGFKTALMKLYWADGREVFGGRCGF